MGVTEDALAAIESLDEREQFTYQATADIYGMSRTTLSRRHWQVQGSREGQAINLQLLSPHQEEEFVKYIIELTERGLPPTREMIQNFAREVVKKEVGNGWVTRFVERNKD
ncbi:hypothetical protein EJ02DRAFT_458019 [Clathrospora elynae]|uniref:HTH CENPB-type domain-containing protein n=1 Tax=Clathrospora elynae TaxID=706981 RepID=A0A6A5SCB7_9PLEO|nr:hypothetical protein EJ02DRAFT_458019 [Clathrospora elynae]